MPCFELVYFAFGFIGFRGLHPQAGEAGEQFIRAEQGREDEVPEEQTEEKEGDRASNANHGTSGRQAYARGREGATSRRILEEDRTRAADA